MSRVLIVALLALVPRLTENIRLGWMPDGDKHSSLLRYKMNNGRKKFYEKGPSGASTIKTSQIHNIRAPY